MTQTLADVYLDNDAFAERIPHETFTLMRHQAPVHWYDWSTAVASGASPATTTWWPC